MQVLPLDDPEGFLVTVRVVLDDKEDFHRPSSKQHAFKMALVDTPVETKVDPQAFAASKIAYALDKLEERSDHLIVGTQVNKWPKDVLKGPFGLQRKDGSVAWRVEDLRWEVYEKANKPKKKKRSKKRKK